MSFFVNIETYFDEAANLSVVRPLLKKRRTKRITARLTSFFRQLTALPSATSTRRGDRVYFPFGVSPEQIKIEKALEGTSYRIKDYKKGTVTDPYGRVMRLGRALQKLNLLSYLGLYSDDLTRSDPAPSMQLVFSKHPYDIAVMSTGRRWSSCMSLLSASGERQKGAEVFVGRDIAHGVIVCYLIQKDDLNIENPLARLLLKPYVREGATGGALIASRQSDDDVIYVLDNKRYGFASDSFRESIMDIVNQIQPEKYGTFRLSKTLYCGPGEESSRTISKGQRDTINTETLPTTKEEVAERVQILKNLNIIRSWVQYTIKEDLSVDVHGDVTFDEDQQIAWKILPVQFGEITGDFTVRNILSLRNLQGAPRRVIGTFRWVGTSATSLAGGPEVVRGDYYCFDNRLTSLVGAPKDVAKFVAYKNFIRSLVGGPERARTYSVGGNPLISLVGMPSSVDTLNVSETPLRDFTGVTKADAINASEMPHLRTLRGIPTVREAILRKCPQLETLVGLNGPIDLLELDALPKLSYAQFPKEVGLLTIDGAAIQSGAAFAIPRETRISHIKIWPQRDAVRGDASFKTTIGQLRRQFPHTNVTD